MHIHSGGENSDDNDSMDDEKAAKSIDFKKEIAEMPIISNEGYYWIGKDYSNCYKQDFQNIEEFSKGNLSLIEEMFFFLQFYQSFYRSI